MRISASWPLNFERHEPPCRRASSSTTIQPTLWRLRAYSRPGLPSPATSRSSEVPWRRGHRRMRYSAFDGAGLAAGAGGGVAFSGLAFGGGFFTLGGSLALGSLFTLDG